MRARTIASMLIGSFYAHYLATSDLPDDWAERVMSPVWPEPGGSRASQ